MDQELEAMYRLERLPLAKEGITVHYEGSIDKQGANADWDWALYQDENKEWVLFETFEPGCIYNFVQHRYLVSPQPVFRFYFDGEQTPRFEITPAQFGEKYPFLAPLDDKFIGPGGWNRAIRVVRSFVPMPFAKSCKITSSIQLSGNAIPGGGWGHVIWHAYSDGRAVRTFDPNNPDYRILGQFYRSVDKHPFFTSKEQRSASAFTLAPGERRTVFCAEEGAMLSGIQCQTADYRPEHLQTLHVKITFDDHPVPDVDCPFGCLFSNELGYHSVRYLFSGADAAGGYYCCYPMPFRKKAVVEVQNTGSMPVRFDLFSVCFTQEFNELYRQNRWGYFSNSPYYPKTHTKGADSIIAKMSGSGHIVGSVITGYGITPGAQADCEGDVRVHFGGIRTPQIESDGSESYSCYGWGFCSPPQYNPFGGYDGKLPDVHYDWSMTRLLPGDCYPYTDGFRFGIESFGNNDRDMYHSGTVFFYHCGPSRRIRIAELLPGCAPGQEQNGLICPNGSPVRLTSFFEGDDDDQEITLSGYYPESQPLRFSVSVPKGTKNLILRRVSDQKDGPQMASVWVNGKKIPDRPWYFPDHNPYKRWLEDEYIIPASCLGGEDTVAITLKPERCQGKLSFNLFGMTVFAEI